jgi:light-regulated signal transduction histidine kinase (bacteriophytochrome)
MHSKQRLARRRVRAHCLDVGRSGIVREIIEAMGGSIEVDSRVDEGSTFTVSLPRSRLEAGNRSGEGWGVRPD